MAVTELVFPKTELGDLRVRYRKLTTINAETVVEARTRSLLFARRLEQRRRELANGNNSLGDASYYTGRL